MSPGWIVNSLIGVVFALAGPGAIFYAGTAWENRPANWPNVAVGKCPAPRLPIIGALPVCFHLGFGSGPGARLAAVLAANKAQATRVQTVIIHEAAITQAVNTSVVAARASDERAGHDLDRYITQVLGDGRQAGFSLTVGFGRLHDAAARGADVSAVPDPAGRPDDAPAAISAEDAAAAVKANLGLCRRWGEDDAAWSSWYDQASAQWAADLAAAQTQSAPAVKPGR